MRLFGRQQLVLRRVDGDDRRQTERGSEHGRPPDVPPPSGQEVAVGGQQEHQGQAGYLELTAEHRGQPGGDAAEDGRTGAVPLLHPVGVGLGEDRELAGEARSG